MKLITIAFFSTLLFACNSQSNTAANTVEAGSDSSTTGMVVQDTGWVSLFDGKTFNGWHTFGQTHASPDWSVDDGVIHLLTDSMFRRISSIKYKSGDLVSNDSFSNFDLKLDWKIIKGGNSGVIFYVQDDKPKYGDTYVTGPEMQVLDDERNDDNKKPSHHAGSLYDMIPATPGAVKPAEQWNAAEIVSNNGKLDFYLNGVHVVNTTIFDDNWKKMIANSKFKQWPTFGTFKTGHIALQNHGFEVWYKNIMIKKL